eukprot:11182090-Lingulodinium_polyedra.AAC.1
MASNASRVGSTPKRSHAMRRAATAAMPPGERAAQLRGRQPSPDVPVAAGKRLAAPPISRGRIGG